MPNLYAVKKFNEKNCLFFEHMNSGPGDEHDSHEGKRKGLY